MGGVDADAQPVGALRQQVEDHADLLEAVAQGVTRADIVLQQQHDLWRRFGQDALDGFGDTRDARLHARAAMAARMEDDGGGPQQRSALQCPAQQVDRLAPNFLFGRGQVDEVGRVDDDRRKLVLARRFGEGQRGPPIIGWGTPAGGVAGKNLDGVAADVARDGGGPDRLRVERHVATKTHYSSPPPGSCSLNDGGRSTPGSWSSRVRPNCCKNSAVVAKSAGRPTVGARPTSATSPCCTRLSSARSLLTPRTASICARVTGWR